MIKIDPKKWNISTISNDTEKLFIEKWIELFNRYTIDTYRVRFHNSHTILQEFTHVIDAVHSSELSPRQLKFLAEEAGDILREDQVFRKCVKSYGVIQQELNSQLSSKDDLYTRKLRLYIDNLLLQLSSYYTNELLDSLEVSISSHDLNQTLTLTGLLASELLNRGFSQFYCYNMSEAFFDRKYRDFAGSYSKFRAIINKNEETFAIVIKISSSMLDPPANLFGIEFSKRFDIQSTPKINSYLAGADYVWYAKITQDARDPQMAALIGARKLEGVLDILNYGLPDQSFELDAKSVACREDLSLSWLVDTKHFIPGYYRADQRWFERTAQEISRIDNEKRINDATKDKLRSSFRYLRQGRAAISFEEKFLNFWIAFEFLMRMSGSNVILETILEFAPKILCLYYPRRLLRDLIENLNRLDVQYDPALRKILDTERTYSKKETSFLQIIRDSNLRASLESSCASLPLLKSRIAELDEKLGSSESAWKTVEKHRNNVKRHLARMYRIRNRIVHGAAHNLSIDHLSANLLAYLVEILNELIYQLPSAGRYNSIEDLMLSYSFVYDTWIQMLKGDKKNILAIEDIVEPLSQFHT